ncbi:MAG: sulfotransferase [Pseudohongiellaceae bacterium]
MTDDRNIPGDVDALGAQATRMAHRGDWSGAAHAFTQLTRLAAPDDRRGWEGLARARFALQDLTEAQRLAEDMQRRFPGWAYPHLLAGHLHKALGETEAALGEYKEALRCQPDNGEALFGLVELRVPDPDDATAQQTLQVADDESASIADRINASFAAGRILDRAGQFEQAFAQFRQGNDLTREERERQGIIYRPGQREEEIRRRIARYPASSFHTRLSPLPIDLTPIFVVGMPRSGTTLIEQILASHPEVEAAGELITAHECENRFLSAREKAGRTGPVNPADPGDASLLEDAREQYVDALFEHDLDGPFVVDKMPANFELTGFLRLLFPEAPILHSARDPRATSFSLFSANFGGHDPYYNDLEHLAHYYQQYRRIMSHWRTVVPDPLTDVTYEDLVGNPEKEIPSLLRAAGLEPHENCLDFHRTERPVLTASHAQVRRPVYRSAVDHWRHYETWLGPILRLRDSE